MDYLITLFDLSFSFGSFVSYTETIALLIFIYYTQKSKGQSVRISWYIAGFFFPLITFLIFIGKNERTEKPDTIPTEALEYEPDEKPNNYNKITKISKIIFICCAVVSIALTVYSLAVTVPTLIDELKNIEDSYSYDETQPAYACRLGVTDKDGNTLYYDMEGNSYTDPFDVVLYDKAGGEYTYISEEYFGVELTFYTDAAGNMHELTDCYVDSEGYFVCDTNGGSITLDEALHRVTNPTFEGMKYYDWKYYDEEGNVYYYAEDASWNEKGELITAENDE